MSTGKIELSVGAIKIADKYEIFDKKEIDAINNKIPELDERVDVIKDEIDEINSSLDNKASNIDMNNIQSQINNLVLNGDGTQNLEVIQARGDFKTLNDRISDYVTISRNVLNPSTITIGKNISASGEVVDLATTSISEFIELPTGDVHITRKALIEKNGGVYAISLYDKDKNFITRYYNDTPGIVLWGISNSLNIKFVRFCIGVGTEKITIVIDKENKNYTDLPYLEYGKWINYEYLSKYNFIKSNEINNIVKEEINKTDFVTKDVISDIVKEEINKEGVNPLEKIIKDGGMYNIFKTSGVVGDSLSSGCMEYRDTNGTAVGIDMYEYSWIQRIGKITGNTCYNFSAGGLTTRKFFTTSNDKVRSIMDEDKKCQAYHIALGVNDVADTTLNVGLKSDINLSNKSLNSDTFYGNYGKIIQTIKEIQPKAKIFLHTMHNFPQMTKWGKRFTDFNNAIKDMVNIFDNCYVLDFFTFDVLHDEEFQKKFYNGFHDNVLGYQRKAYLIISYVDWIINNNYEEFREIPFIGSSKYFYK